MKAFVSWSGGKETSLACYKIMQSQDAKITYFLNMASEDGQRSRSHGVSSQLLKAQAQAAGVPIIQKRTTWENYEEKFKKAVLELKKKGVNAGIFGDIDLKEHRDWVERICRDVGIKPMLPLWQRKREEILREFIQAGFRAMVVTTAVNFLGIEWLGRQINREFIEDLKILKDIDLCGEKGEYHTFVYDGPIFKKPVELVIGKKILNNKHWFLGLEFKKDKQHIF